MVNEQIFGHKNIAARFKGFNKEMRDIWEAYNLINFYLPILHNSVKKGKISPLKFAPLFSNKEKSIKVDDTLGAFSHLHSKSNPRNSFIEAVIAFEDFISFVASTVYSDFPHKLLSQAETNGGDSIERRNKLLRTILDSNDRDEIIEKIIEEKSRAIFYGNFSDFFIKDKAKLEFGDYFRGGFKHIIEDHLVEITARRNIIIHNNGRVDRKYLRETKKSPFSLGAKVKITNEYLKYAILTLQGIAANTGAQIIEKIYKSPVRGKLKKLETITIITWGTNHRIEQDG